MELRVPPVAVVVVAAVLMWLLAWSLPTLQWQFPGRLAFSGILVVAGAAIALAGVWQFRRSRTTVNPLTPEASSVLVMHGIYRWTRNPMYAGFALALLGFAIFLGNPLSLLVVPAFAAYITRFQILPEERALAAIFGDEFSAYCARVRRWV